MINISIKVKKKYAKLKPKDIYDDSLFKKINVNSSMRHIRLTVRDLSFNTGQERLSINSYIITNTQCSRRCCVGIIHWRLKEILHIYIYWILL